VLSQMEFSSSSNSLRNRSSVATGTVWHPSGLEQGPAGAEAGAVGAVGDVDRGPGRVRICVVEVPEEHPLRRRD
jgi:hypothetical protein